ncbi:hypothetical protein L1887_55230 [Cichorium endivia]|nr:hypothetical protein L1887_55230 [Cichorium endivia]
MGLQIDGLLSDESGTVRRPACGRFGCRARRRENPPRRCCAPVPPPTDLEACGDSAPFHNPPRAELAAAPGSSQLPLDGETFTSMQYKLTTSSLLGRLGAGQACDPSTATCPTDAAGLRRDCDRHLGAAVRPAGVRPDRPHHLQHHALPLLRLAAAPYEGPKPKLFIGNMDEFITKPGAVGEIEWSRKYAENGVFRSTFMFGPRGGALHAAQGSAPDPGRGSVQLPETVHGVEAARPHCRVRSADGRRRHAQEDAQDHEPGLLAHQPHRAVPSVLRQGLSARRRVAQEDRRVVGRACDHRLRRLGQQGAA